ncbi:hypothetical protein ABS767_05860 [Sphingomonas sp. ST-64]|uniref:DUF805 domain-containing protein n=2 Tax=Sphingomonas plantiphila TaxID=3163295 RepID=A0ABW8YMZ9_9SPHN
MFGVSNQRRYALALPPVVIVFVLLIMQVWSDEGGLELVVGSAAWLYGGSVVVWTVCTALAIRRMRWGWLLLLTAPVVFGPALLYGLLLAVCASGNCL